MGRELLKKLVKETNLPEEPLQKELSQLLEEARISEGELTLEGLRKVMANYLQDVFLQLKEESKEGLEIVE